MFDCQVRGQDSQAAVGLHPLQQVADLDVRVSIVAVLNLAALAEQRISLVDHQHRAAVLGGVEHPPEVLLGLADVLAHDLAQVDPVKIHVQLGGYHLGCERLAGSARTGEERRHPGAVAAGPGDLPLLVDQGTVARVAQQIPQ